MPGVSVCALQAIAQAVPPEFQVNTTTNAGQFDPAVTALAEGRLLVAWHDEDAATAKVQRFTATATKVGGELTAPDVPGTMGPSSNIGPRVTGLIGGGAVVAWTGTEDDIAELASANGVAAQMYDGNFVKVGAKINVNTTTVGRQTVGGVAPLTNGGFVVTWESAPLSGATGQDGSGRGIYARRFNADGGPASGEFRVNTQTTGDQIEPRISALVNGGFVIIWMDEAEFTFKAQRFSFSGSATGGEILIGGSAENSAVAGLKDGGFVALWTGEVGGAGLEACVRQYGASGAPVTGEFQVNTYQTGTQRSWGIAGLANGGYVVLWTSDDQDGSKTGVYGQKLTPASFNDGAEFQVNVQTLGAQSRASVAALGSGFVATWSSSNQDGSSWGVYGRRFGDTSDEIMGTAGPDNLIGTPGDDIIIGRGGVDEMTGLAGHDTYFVDNTGDVIVESPGDGTDAIRSSVTYALPAKIENLVLTGSGGTNGTGNTAANTISGNIGDNKLNGKLGNDVLIGNSGHDRFQFDTELNATTNVDLIGDFNLVEDQILLQNAIFTALTTTGTLPAASFHAGPAASNTSHRIIYSPTKASLYYDADGSGPIAAIRFAKLTPGLTLTNAHFFVH